MSFNIGLILHFFFLILLIQFGNSTKLLIVNIVVFLETIETEKLIYQYLS